MVAPILAGGLGLAGGTVIGSAVASIFGAGGTTKKEYTYYQKTTSIQKEIHAPYEYYAPVQTYAPQYDIVYPQYQISISSPQAQQTQTVATKKEMTIPITQQPDLSRQFATAQTPSITTEEGADLTRLGVIFALALLGSVVLYKVL